MPVSRDVHHQERNGAMTNISLQEARLKNGLTQAGVAKMVGITTSGYQNYELCVRTPNVYTAQKLANALNTTIEDIFPLEREVVVQK